MLLQLHSQNGWLPPCLAAQNGLPSWLQSSDCISATDYFMHLSPLKMHLHLKLCLNACNALFQHRIEHFTDKHRQIHTGHFYYSISMSHRDPWGFFNVAYLNVHFDERLSDQCCTKKSPEGDQKVSACYSCQVKQGIGNLRKNQMHDQSQEMHPCVFSVDICRMRRIILCYFIIERIKTSLCGTYRGTG